MSLLVWFVKDSVVSLWCTFFVYVIIICVNLSRIFKTAFVLTIKCWFLSVSVNLPSKAGRKLLQKDLNNNSTSQGDSKQVSSSQVGIFAGGALLVCCAVVCPCFYGKRRKATSHAVLEKDPNSSELMFVHIYLYLIVW